MPKWCTNQIHVFGSKGEIRDFHASLNKIIAANKKENTSHHWLYDVSEFFHWKRENHYLQKGERPFPPHA